MRNDQQEGRLKKDGRCDFKQRQLRPHQIHQKDNGRCIKKAISMNKYEQHDLGSCFDATSSSFAFMMRTSSLLVEL